MRKEEKRLIRRVLSDVVRIEERGFDAVASVGFVHSPEFIEAVGEARMKADKRENQGFYWTYRKTVAVALVAVLLLLTATACTFKDEIRDFFLSVSDGWISYRAEQNPSDPKKIKVYYEPIFPEDYQIVSAVADDSFLEVRLRSMDMLNNTAWTQALPSVEITTCAEGHRTLEDNGIVYHIVESLGLLRISWIADDYVFTLTMTEEMNDDELLAFLRTVHPVDSPNSAE